MTTGNLTLPLVEDQRERVLSVKRGEVPRADTGDGCQNDQAVAAAVFAASGNGPMGVGPTVLSAETPMAGSIGPLVDGSAPRRGPGADWMRKL